MGELEKNDKQDESPQGDQDGIEHVLVLACAVSTFAFVAITAFWVFASRPLLLMLGQEAVVAEHASMFLLCLTPALLGIFLTELLKRVLVVLQSAGYLFQVGVFGVCVSLMAQGVFVWGQLFQTGAYASCVAVSFTYICMTVYLIVLLCWICTCTFTHESKVRIKWPHSMKDSFTLKKVYQFAGLTVSTSVMVFCEWIAFEAISLSAGMLGSTYLSAQPILIHIDSILFMIPMGIAGASGVYIAGLIGQGEWREAKRALGISCACVAAPALLSAGMLVVARRWVGFLVTEEIQVVRIVDGLVPFVAFNQVSSLMIMLRCLCSLGFT